MSYLFSVVIPVYNEEETLEFLLGRFETLSKEYFGELDFEFIFVNDGSNDRSFSILKSFAKKKVSLKVKIFCKEKSQLKSYII